MTKRTEVDPFPLAVLFAPVRKLFYRNLPTLRGGSMFQKEPLEAQAHFFEGMVYVAMWPAVPDEEWTPAEFLGMMYMRFPDIVSWLLPRLREHAMNLATGKGRSKSKEMVRAMLGWSAPDKIVPGPVANGRKAAKAEARFWTANNSESWPKY